MLIYFRLKVIFILSITTIITRSISLPVESKVKRFLNSEFHILETLQKQIDLKENHIQHISSQLEPLSVVVSGRGARDEYLNNPLHTVTLVRRLTTDWLALANLLGDHSILSGEKKIWEGQTKLHSVVRNLARAQLTYNLNTDHLADSVLEDTPAKVNITGADCYLMARHYYQQHHYSEAVQWLDQALSKHDNTVNRDLVLELAALSYCFSGDSGKSASKISSLMKDFPGHKPSKALVQDWQFMINTDCEQAESIKIKEKNQAAEMFVSATIEYNRLCQGRVNITSDLKCRYVHYNKAHLRLAPFRLEELQIDPPVVLFHNVINELEIEEAKRKAKLKTSKVVGSNGSSVEDSYRTSETAWINDRESNILDNLSKRIKDMTNLDTKFAESHQISRYGLGGEYLFHEDYFGEDYVKQYGDRIATLMFYLSDVPRGGHTVFYSWKLSVKPQKGSALLWFNLHPNGTGDKSTAHAGCSVLQGTKWVLNKWFHELNNDITRPCYLDRKQTHKYFYL